MILKHKRTGESMEVEIRSFRPSDAPQLIECIRSAYGGTYVKPFLYREEEVVRMDQTGEMRFSVAETADHRLAGITAYEVSEEFPQMAEIACQVIQEFGIGYGLALPLALHSMHRAEEERLSAQFSRALGCHLISQKTLKAMGFTACGFLLHVFDKEKFLLRFPNGNYAKIPQAVAVKRQDKLDAGRVWVPEEFRSLLNDIYTQLGVTWTPTAAGAPGSETQMIREQDQEHRNLTLRAVRCGADFGQQLREAIAAVSDDPTQTVNLYLNLTDPGSAAAYEAARAQGFLVTGFLPCCPDGEYMILHDPLQVPVHLEEIPYIPEYLPFLEEIRRQL